MPSLEHLDDMRVVQSVLPPPEELQLLVSGLSWNRVLQGLQKVSILVGDVIAVVPFNEVEGLVAEGPARGPAPLGKEGRTDMVPRDTFTEITLALSPCTRPNPVLIIEKIPHRVEGPNDILLVLVFERIDGRPHRLRIHRFLLGRHQTGVDADFGLREMEGRPEVLGTGFRIGSLLESRELGDAIAWDPECRCSILDPHVDRVREVLFPDRANEVHPHLKIDEDLR